MLPDWEKSVLGQLSIEPEMDFSPRGSSLKAVCKIAYLLALLFSSASALLGLDPSKQIDQYGHGVWTSQHGLPGDAVYQIMQTPDGYLWMRTSAGLVRFDGVRFVSMDPVIGSGPVKAITIGADGDLLIRTNSRTLVYRNGSFSDYRRPGALPDGGIQTLVENSRHEVLLGSDDFIYLIQNEGIRMLLHGSGHVDALAQDKAGRLWIGGAYALYSYQDGKLSTALDTRAGHGSMSISALAVDHRQNLWVGTWSGLYRGESGRLPLTRIAPDSIHAHIQAILEDRQGSLWVGTDDQGLMRVNGDQVTSFSAADGLSDNRVLSLFEDREGSLWVGTAGGLDHFRNTKITTLTMKEGLPSNDTRAVFETREGDLYVFCIPGGLAVIKNDQAIEVTKDAALSYQGNGVFQSKDGSLWLGTFGGLTRFKDGKFTVYDPEGRFSKYHISTISEDDESLIVTTNDQAAFRFKDGQVRPFTIRGQDTPLTRPGNYTITIYRDPSGTLWFGTVHGLFKFAPGQPPMQARQSQVDFAVTTISDDHKGNLWLGGRVPGLARFRIQDGHVTHYGQKDGLFDDFPSSVLLDDDDNLWISTASGIYKARRKDLNDLAEGRISRITADNFSTDDGMKTSEANLALSQPAGWRTTDGHLWFTTTKGVVVLDPRHIPHNDMVPPVIVENIVVNDRSMPVGNNLQIPPGRERLEFHYTALSMLIPDRVKFKYLLEGYDRDWVDAGTRRVAYYTNLPPGPYRFRVIACNDDGVWNEQGASVGFLLRPFYYQTDWFRTLCIVILAATVIVVFRFNTRRLHKQAEELTRIVDERTKSLQLEVLERQRAEDSAVQARENMRFQATHDALTSLLNRGSILEVLDHELPRSVREKTCIAVLMGDLDHFKDVNDKHGHMVGDQVLHEAATRLQKSVRASDFVGRYGGEEFLVVLSNCDTDQAIKRAEELRQAIAAKPVETDCGPIPITISMGVLSTQHWRSSSSDQVLREVDAVLYAAKEAGRNCFCVAAPNASHLVKA
jgi:diguanylate cyclase (GGDEF)-like protein